MKSSKMNKMKKRLLALLLCMVMMMNGSVSALASEVTASDEVNAISQDAGTQTASLETVHEHTGECYSRSKVSDALICGKEVVEGHTHGDACYEVTNTPECICTLEETAGHSHDEGCYTTVETKNCSLEEHSHGDGCYTTEFTCGTEEHSHGDECFITETVNVCGQEEVEAHTHGDGCYTTVENKTLTCELEEAEGHAHSDECYEWTEELTCTIPTETPTVEPEITTCEVCGKETCECEAEIEICEVCGKETCECEAEEEAEPVALTTEVDGTTITLVGPAEAFQEGMSYSIEATVVEAKKEIKVIEEVLEEVAVEQEKVVKSYQAFDIKIIETDEEGNVTNDNFQPLNETPVMVTFSSKEVTESVENEETVTSVLHVDTEKKEAEDMAAEVTEDKDVAIETTHFSIYVYVELGDRDRITLTLEHWIEGTEEKLFEDSKLELEKGFSATAEELANLCFDERADYGYYLSKVYRHTGEFWLAVTEDIVLTDDETLRVEYTPELLASDAYMAGYTPKKAGGGISKSKIATDLRNDWTSDVTLSVGGIATGEPIDVVFVLGGSMTANQQTVASALEVFESVMGMSGDGAPMVKVGLIAVEKGKEIIVDLADEEAVLQSGTYKEFISEKFDYINTLPSGSTNLHSQLVEAKKMLDADGDVAPENKYLFVIATGRTYCFDDVNGNEATILAEANAKGNYAWGNYVWQQQRAVGTSYYQIPTKTYESYDDYFSAIVNWVEGELEKDKYVYTFPLNKEDGEYAFYNWAMANSLRNCYLDGGTSGTRIGTNIETISPTDFVATNKIAGVPHKYSSLGGPAHALNYERAQYEAFFAYKALCDAGYNCYSLCSEQYRYQNNSSYISGNGSKGLKLQIGHSFMDFLARYGGQEAAVVLYENDGSKSGKLREDFFEEVKAHIIKNLSKDSTVVDYIGYYNDGEGGEEDYDFDFVDDVDNTEDDPVLMIGDNELELTKVERTNEGITYYFNEDAHVVEYKKGNTKDTEHFVWTINEDVVGSAASFKYTVLLKEKDVTTLGKHEAYTNQKAILYPVDSDGVPGEKQYFERPTVSYNVMELDITKTDTNQTKVLEGAEFALSLKNPEVKDKIFLTESGFAEKDGVVKATSITGTDGKATFKVISTLDAVECILKETKSPSGYMLDESEREVILKGNEIIEIAITNMPIYELPSTGGYGSFLYTLSGAALVLGSSLMKYKKKREEELGSEE